MIETQHRDMVMELVKDPKLILAAMTEKKAALIHAVLGIAGEVAELQDLDGTPEHLLEESGDTLFYCRDMRILYNLPTYCPAVIDSNYTTYVLAVAAGQIVDAAKKHVVYGQAPDTSRLLDALDIVETCVSFLLRGCGFKREDALKHNIEKLLTGPNARYAGGYSDEAAAARADKAPVEVEKYATSWGVGAVDPLISELQPVQIPGGGRVEFLGTHTNHGQAVTHVKFYEPGASRESLVVVVDCEGEVERIWSEPGIDVYTLPSR